jgi:hypothetical protein
MLITINHGSDFVASAWDEKKPIMKNLIKNIVEISRNTRHRRA